MRVTEQVETWSPWIETIIPTLRATSLRPSGAGTHWMFSQCGGVWQNQNGS
jgi:hypothetical protein